MWEHGPGGCRREDLSGRRLQATQAGKPRVAYPTIKRLLLHKYCAVNLKNLFECCKILRLRGLQNTESEHIAIVLIVETVLFLGFFKEPRAAEPRGPAGLAGGPAPPNLPGNRRGPTAHTQLRRWEATPSLGPGRFKKH